jgi:adenylate cyclase
LGLRRFRFRHFSSQLLLVLTGLVATVQVAVYLLVARASEQSATAQITRNLDTGAMIFRQNLEDRIAFLTTSARVLSNDYEIRQLAMREPVDRAMLQQNLARYAGRIRFNAHAAPPVITLFSPPGEIVALSVGDQTLGEENTGPFRHLIKLAADAGVEQAAGYSYLAGQLHVLVVVPLYGPAPQVAGWFGLAYPIDTTIARAIKETTQLEVTFSSDPGEPNHRVLSTTLPAALAAELLKSPAPHGGPAPAVARLRLAGEPWIAHIETLELLGEAPATITLQRSLQAELAPARQLERAVLLISLGALAAAVVAASAIARSVSAPVRLLARHTEYVAAGDYTRRIDLPRADELGQLATAFNQMTGGLAERDRVRDLLGKVVSPEIATQLLRAGVQLGGEEREVTVLFSDLRDFTTLSERLAPAEMLALLNRYLDRMSTIIERHGGVIDKYIGDAIMALFGAPVADPDAPGRAVAAAREMVGALADLNAELRAEGRPTLAFGIGINTARVVAGNMGSKTRLNYTVIGDGVNLASRLEGLTKDPAYATPIILSETSLRAMANPPPVRELGEVKVKGRSGTVRIFAVATPDAPNMP